MNKYIFSFSVGTTTLLTLLIATVASTFFSISAYAAVVPDTVLSNTAPTLSVSSYTSGTTSFTTTIKPTLTNAADNQSDQVYMFARIFYKSSQVAPGNLVIGDGTSGTYDADSRTASLGAETVTVPTDGNASSFWITTFTAEQMLLGDPQNVSRSNIKFGSYTLPLSTDVATLSTTNISSCLYENWIPSTV